MTTSSWPTCDGSRRGRCRQRSNTAHVPGAISFDLDRDLAKPAYHGPGRHPLPSPGSFASTMGAAGIGDDTPVVAYDDVGGWVASRLWWMLHVTGHRPRCWTFRRSTLGRGGRQLVTGRPNLDRRRRTPSVPWPADRVVDADKVRAELREGSAVVLDVRAGERYRGEVEPIDPVAGHIPGAVNAPWQGNRHDDGAGDLLSPDELRRRYEDLGMHHGTLGDRFMRVRRDGDRSPCSRWSWRACRAPSSTRDRGRIGSMTPRGRSRPVPNPAACRADRKAVA